MLDVVKIGAIELHVDVKYFYPVIIRNLQITILLESSLDYAKSSSQSKYHIAVGLLLGILICTLRFWSNTTELIILRYTITWINLDCCTPSWSNMCVYGNLGMSKLANLQQVRPIMLERGCFLLPTGIKNDLVVSRNHISGWELWRSVLEVDTIQGLLLYWVSYDNMPVYDAIDGSITAKERGLAEMRLSI